MEVKNEITNSYGKVIEKEVMTVDRYIEKYNLIGPEILIEKDQIYDSYGKIWLPPSRKEVELKASSTGVVLKLPQYTDTFSESELEILKMLKVGTRIGFWSTNPTQSPAPPFYDWGKELGRASCVYQLALVHVMGIIK